MKKLIVLFSILFFTALGISAETHFYTTKLMNAKIKGKPETGWTFINTLNLSIDTDTRRIVIDSPEIQIIDFTAFSTRKGSDFKEIKASATDYHYIPINIYMTEYNDGNFYLTIEYADVRYTYKLDPVI